MSDVHSQLASLRESIRNAAALADDPFEAFNAAQGMGTIRDPHPIFAAMRATAPIHRIDLKAMGGGPLEAPRAVA